MLRASLYANLALLFVVLFLGVGWQTTRVQMKADKLKAAQAQVRALAELDAAKEAASKELAEVRSRIPKAGRKVSDAAHANPSDCVVAAPVGDGLREAVREGNAARRSDGALP